MNTPKKEKALPAYTTAADFFFKTPPYDRIQTTVDDITNLLHNPLRMEGFCPECRQLRVFNRTSGEVSFNWLQKYDHSVGSVWNEIQFRCTFNEKHMLRFLILITDGVLRKWGQYPSFADIALDESKDYSKLLDKGDSSEFHKAIGLAAHNVGIGSYVYLRRIFERLIVKRFKEFKETEGWKDEEFYGVRMDDKIKLLKDHLPPFLVKNAKIYSILSLGIHELEEEQCLGFFRVLRQSLIIILEEDKKKKEELELQRQLEKEIAGFTHKTGPAVEQMSLADLGNKPPQPEIGSK
ncbi:hypothetical protein ACVWYQ_000765 [Bradyrhizobium sp. USDA 3397]